MTFYQIFLPVFTLTFVLKVFVIHSFIQYKKTNKNPFVFEKNDSAHSYLSKVYKAMMVLSFCCIVVYSFFPNYYEILYPIYYLDYNILRISGVLMLVFSLVWIVISQQIMSRSWRIGIDYKEKTDLITNGTFKISRNPVFLGILLINTGTFLIIPNTITLLVLSVIYIIFQIQVRMEEEFLVKTHVKEYEQYLNSVKRWIGIKK